MKLPHFFVLLVSIFGNIQDVFGVEVNYLGVLSVLVSGTTVVVLKMMFLSCVWIVRRSTSWKFRFDLGYFFTGHYHYLSHFSHGAKYPSSTGHTRKNK